MAKIRRSQIKRKLELKSKVRIQKTIVKVSIPKESTVPSVNFKDYSILIHGEKKIGKTTLFAQEKGAFFLEFDPLQRALAIRQKHIPDWAHFMAYLDLLETDTTGTETVIVDGTDIAYQLCFDWCCTKLAITHPHDENDYGKSWKFIRDTFEKAMLRLLSLNGIAVRFICHSKWTEVDTREKGKVEKLIPYLTSQAEEVLNGRIDLWAAYIYYGNKRMLVIQGDESTGAGHRIDSQFFTPEGERVVEIDMGKNAKESYHNLVTAFQNKQTYTHVVVVKKKKKKKRRL